MQSYAYLDTASLSNLAGDQDLSQAWLSQVRAGRLRVSIGYVGIEEILASEEPYRTRDMELAKQLAPRGATCDHLPGVVESETLTSWFVFGAHGRRHNGLLMPWEDVETMRSVVREMREAGMRYREKRSEENRFVIDDLQKGGYLTEFEAWSTKAWTDAGRVSEAACRLADDWVEREPRHLVRVFGRKCPSVTEAQFERGWDVPWAKLYVRLWLRTALREWFTPDSRTENDAYDLIHVVLSSTGDVLVTDDRPLRTSVVACRSSNTPMVAKTRDALMTVGLV